MLRPSPRHAKQHVVAGWHATNVWCCCSCSRSWVYAPNLHVKSRVPDEKCSELPLGTHNSMWLQTNSPSFSDDLVTPDCVLMCCTGSGTWTGSIACCQTHGQLTPSARCAPTPLQIGSFSYAMLSGHACELILGLYPGFLALRRACATLMTSTASCSPHSQALFWCSCQKRTESAALLLLVCGGRLLGWVLRVHLVQGRGNAVQKLDSLIAELWHWTDPCLT